MSFGEHVPDFSYHENTLNKGRPAACHIITMYAMLLGGSAIGLRVWEGRCLVDYLATLPEADTSRLGVMGISGGGVHTFFSACVDTRIKACVISGYFCSWFESTLKFGSCSCNYIPGLLTLGDLPDLAGLLAPQPVLLEAGTYDDIFPVQAQCEAFTRLQVIYELFGAGQKIELDEFEGRHQISGRRAYDFLRENL